MKFLQQARHAFTLIELLVVVTIIAVLMAILIPIIAGALNSADRTATLELVQGLEKAVRIHALDSKGLPMPDLPEDPTPGSAGERVGYFVYDRSDQNPGLINEFVGSQKFTVNGEQINDDNVLIDNWNNPIRYVVGDYKNKKGSPTYDAALPQDLNKPKDAAVPAADSDWNRKDDGKYPYVWSTGPSGEEADWIYIKSE